MPKLLRSSKDQYCSNLLRFIFLAKMFKDIFISADIKAALSIFIINNFHNGNTGNFNILKMFL